MKTVVENMSHALRPTAFLERWSPWIYIGLLASLCALEVALGALPTRIYAHDFFILLDGAWRLANGQTPNVDFYAGYGVWVWNPIRWAFAIYGYNADAIGVARAFYTAALGVWFLLLSRTEWRRSRSIAHGLFLLIFISASRPLGEYPTWVSQAMFYNRVGYVLLFLIMFERLGAFRIGDSSLDRQQNQMQFWRGVSTGAALACTILVKISFVAPALVMVAAGLLLFGINRRHFIGMWAGGLAMLVLAVTCLHFRPLPFLQETVALSHQRANIAKESVTTLVEDMGQILFAVATGVTVALVGFANRRMAHRYIVATVAIAACDIFCRATNAQRSGLPLAAWWCLSGALLLLSAPASQAATERLQRILALLVLCPLAVPMFVMDGSSSVYAVVKTATMRHQRLLTFDSPRLRKWVPQDWLGEDPNFVDVNGKSLILVTNDGIHLLQTLSRNDETIFAIAYDNAFSFALARRPAEGGALWLDVGNNISVEHPMPESMIIGHPDLLMVQHTQYQERTATNAILALYPGLLSQEFAAVGSSQYWTLYRRRP